MKHTFSCLTGFWLIASLNSFQQIDESGKLVFNQNCASCHLPNRQTEIAPSFQNIRKDYGLEWTVAFLRDQNKLLKNKDTRALYSYYIFHKTPHIRFPVLQKEYIVKVLDYVDSYPTDTSQYRHRLVRKTDKLVFIKKHISVDTVNYELKNDTTSFQLSNDTSEIKDVRLKSKRTTNTKRKT
jgi:cytochrome c